jgi:hypothetical protein
VAYQPVFDPGDAGQVQKLAQRLAGLEVSEATWLPFVRSLQNTIINQTTAQDIPLINTPMDVIYGRFDMLIIRGQPQQFFGDRTEHITGHNIRARHALTMSASQFIAERILAASLQ